MVTRQIVFTKPNCAELISTEAEMGAHDVVVETEVSTLSCGTERANIIGDPNVNALGEPSARFPRSSGYSSAGRVVARGEAVKSVEVGDRVVVFWGSHRNFNIMPESNVVRIEDDRISFAEAALSFVATFPLAAIRKTRLELGESVLAMGLGLLGQLAVKLARAAGAAPIVGADPIAERRSQALNNGADYVFDPTEEDFAKNVREVSDGGINAAIEVTGVGAGFDEALDCMAKFGRVALLGCTRDKNFTIDYYRKIHAPGITVIGAHTIARPEVESHPGYFTHRDDIKAVLRLCAGGRLRLSDMIGRTYSPSECGEVYTQLIEDRSFPPVVQFDWSKLREETAV